MAQPSLPKTKHWRFEIDAERLGWLTIDTPKSSVNTLSRETIAVAAAFYLAMMTTECLTLAGADGDISVEGPFANNALFLEMLAAAVARPVFAMRSRTRRLNDLSLVIALLQLSMAAPRDSRSRRPAGERARSTGVPRARGPLCPRVSRWREHRDRGFGVRTAP